MSRLIQLLLAVLLCACTREHRIGIEIDNGGNGGNVAAYELVVTDESCPSATDAASHLAPVESIVRQSFGAEAPMELGHVPSGVHRVFVIGRGSDCTALLYGCEAFVAGEDSFVRVELERIVDPVVAGCPVGLSCSAGQCTEGADGGAPECSACAPESLVSCTAGACALRAGPPDVLADLDDRIGAYRGSVGIAATNEQGETWVHFGVAPQVGAGHAAEVVSLPLASVTDAAARESVRFTDLDDVYSIDVCATANDEAAFSFAGYTATDDGIGSWVGIVSAPGTSSALVPIDSGEPVLGQGPQACVGGAGGHRILHVARTRIQSLGFLSLESANETGTLVAALDPPVPGEADVTGAGSRGAWMTMEYERGGDLLLWSPEATSRFRREAREANAGPPALAYEGGTSYLLAYSTDTSVQLRRMACDADCSFSGATHVELELGAPIEALDVAAFHGGAVLVAVVMRTARTVEAYVLDPNLQRVPAAENPIVLTEIDAVSHAWDLRAAIIEANLLPHLVVVAAVGSTVPEAIRIAHVVFDR